MLVAAAFVDASLAAGKMLQPYWIWESVPLTGALKGAFHLLVQELACQKITQGLYAHSQSELALDEAVQDRVWRWSERMVIDQE